MSSSNNKILKAKVEGIKSSDLDMFKSLIIPFNAIVEQYNKEDGSATVHFKSGIDKKHLVGLGKYTIKPMTYESSDTNDQKMRKRNVNFICDRIVVDEHDIINFFLNITLIAPVTCVLLSLLIFFSVF
ncbi:hypothetical protein MKS88_002235 [Plasmodium brasilianum]|uniref:Uncharacterized protein n=2 Tax=Plasmodium (Plasmodium) TaxID=418103 RepID=A0A1D3PA42_PLAMA|nr:conserved Plasmodium protein, unknown function [Plasmodium malariae]KAI4838730.1 hypothetical protein MKS88_002235 [Plasmodium brasilianum]SCN12063.1 conserved Plasmodium protein, unknown function [Plasmodium malariae]